MHAHDDTLGMICPLLKQTCRSAGCMMWRWATVEQEARSTHERVRLDDGIGLDVAARVIEWPNSGRDPRGYCGLAGVPMAG